MTEADQTAVRLASPPGLFEPFCQSGRIALSGFGGVLQPSRRMPVDERRPRSGGEFNAPPGFCQVLPGSNKVNPAVRAGARLDDAGVMVRQYCSRPTRKAACPISPPP